MKRRWHRGKRVALEACRYVRSYDGGAAAAVFERASERARARGGDKSIDERAVRECATADHAGTPTGSRDVTLDIISGNRCRCQAQIGCLSSSVPLGQRRRLALSCAEAAGRTRNALQTQPDSCRAYRSVGVKQRCSSQTRLWCGGGGTRGIGTATATRHARAGRGGRGVSEWRR